MKIIIISLFIFASSFELQNEKLFADCNYPKNISVIVEPCTNVQAQIISWTWTGVGYYNWYIDGILYLSCVSDATVDYSLVTNPLGLTNGSHIFSVRSTQTDCSNCSPLRSKSFTISCFYTD